MYLANLDVDSEHSTPFDALCWKTIGKIPVRLPLARLSSDLFYACWDDYKQSVDSWFLIIWPSENPKSIFRTDETAFVAWKGKNLNKQKKKKTK